MVVWTHLKGMAFSFKVAAMSFLETAASLAEQFNPLWILPEWLRNFILAGLKVRCCLADVFCFSGFAS